MDQCKAGKWTYPGFQRIVFALNCLLFAPSLWKSETWSTKDLDIFPQNLFIFPVINDWSCFASKVDTLLIFWQLSSDIKNYFWSNLRKNKLLEGRKTSASFAFHMWWNLFFENFFSSVRGMKGISQKNWTQVLGGLGKGQLQEPFKRGSKFMWF